jgi:hypothetical protein
MNIPRKRTTRKGDEKEEVKAGILVQSGAGAIY